MIFYNDDEPGLTLTYRHMRLKREFTAFAVAAVLVVAYMAMALIAARHEVRRLSGEIPAAAAVIGKGE